MDSRERIIRAMELTGPDRVPVMHRSLPGAFRVHGRALEELYERYPSDVLLSPRLKAPFQHLDSVAEGFGEGTTRDIWDCIWRSSTADFAGQVIGHPLADWSRLDQFRFPDPMTGHEIAEELVAVVGKDGHQHYVMAQAGSIFHRYTYLRGMENALIDVVEGSEEFQHLVNGIADFDIARIEFFSQFEEVDGLLIGDDWGTQENLMISPKHWRKWFKPIYKRMVDAIHAGGKYAHLHSDGQIRAIMPDLVGIGWDEINPQVWIMDIAELGREWGGKICVRADLDRQWVLPFGSVEDVEQHVWRTIEAFHRPSGGYIGYGQIGPDVPLRNAEAMLRAFNPAL